MDLDDVIPNPQYQVCHSRVARAPLLAVWDALHRVTMSALPLGHALEGVAQMRSRRSVRSPQVANRRVIGKGGCQQHRSDKSRRATGPPTMSPKRGVGAASVRCDKT